MAGKRLNSVKHVVHHRQDKTDEQHKDDVMVSIINGLNVLIAQASGADMGTASRILYTAKEELVHWAVDMNFHESCKDRFINQHLYDSGLLAIGDFLSRIAEMKDDRMKSEIIRILGLSLMTVPAPATADDAFQS